MIHERFLEKSFIDNYSIHTKHGEIGVSAQGNAEQARAQGNTEWKASLILMCGMIVMVVKATNIVDAMVMQNELIISRFLL
jgi:hypothetical protein